MLTLGRSENEAIIIETDKGPVRVVVVSADRGRVRLGFEADHSIPIYREELLRRKHHESTARATLPREDGAAECVPQQATGQTQGAATESPVR